MSNCSSIFFYCAYIKKTIEAGGTTWSKTKKNSIYVAEQKNKQEKAFQAFPQEGKRLPDMSFDCTGRNSHNLGYLLTAHIMEIGQTESLCAFGRQFINGEFYDFPQILINNRPKDIVGVGGLAPKSDTRLSDANTSFVLVNNHLVFDVVQATILQPFKKERLDIVGLYNLFLFPIGSEDFLHQIFGNLLIYKTTSERHQFRIETFKESFKSSMISFPDFFDAIFASIISYSFYLW